MDLYGGLGGFLNPFAGMGIGSNGIMGALSIAAMVAEKLPGYDIIHSQLQSVNIDLSTVTTWFMVATACWTAWNLVTGNFYMLREKYYCCSIRITSEDGLFHEIFAWLREEKAADINNTRVCDAKKQFDTPDEQVGMTDPYGNPYQNQFLGTTGRQNFQVVYNPAPGALYQFSHKGHTIRIVRENIPEQVVPNTGHPVNIPREAVTLKYYGRSPEVLKAVLDDVVARSNQRDQGKTVVYQAIVMHHGNRWDRCTSRPNRAISTVILEEDQKSRVVDDIEEYLLPATGKWYANRGLPYRRGYLLYGPPGTGKTSLSMALAGHFNLEVYALSVTTRGLTDENLASLFSLLPKRCIVLLEDVDASGVKRNEETSNSEEGSPETMTPMFGRVNHFLPEPRKSKVTFSGLINAIDGAAAKEGRILIMTTNHRERLDEALIRPGRVDLQIAFSAASKPVIAGLFEKLYDDSGDDLPALYMPADFPSKKEILELARQFSELVPEGRFTPAEIQGLLLLYKKNPRTALEMAPSWVQKMLAAKDAGKEAGKEAKAELITSVDPS